MKIRLLALAAVGIVATGAMAHGPGTGHSREITSCADLRVQFGQGDVLRAEETVTVSGSTALEIEGARNGGVTVRGWDGRDFSVTLCKAVPSEQGTTVLDQIHASLEGNRLAVRGPSGERWMGFLLVQAPRGATLGVKATNGPVSLRDLNGQITVATKSGPLSIDRFSGTIEGAAQNGPISVSRSSGDVRLSVQNGPLTVKLDGERWNGAGLVGSAKNGPVSLELPDRYESGIVLEGSRHSPVRCRAEACRSTIRTSSENHQERIEIGPAPAAIRLSTVNGPLTVSSATD